MSTLRRQQDWIDVPVRKRRWVAPAWLAVIATFALFAATLLPVLAPASAAAAATTTSDSAAVSADPLPTVQIDGVVWSQIVAGNTVYVGGSFANARPAGAAPGVNTTPRSNLLAYNLQTGNLVTSWAPSANAQVLGVAVSPDGTRVYVAGDFTSISGAVRYRIAAFDTTTGSLVSSFAPVVNGEVNNIAATNSTVYFAGSFTSVGGTARTKVAAVSADTGAVLPFNATIAGGYGARAIVASPDGSKVVIAGSFTSTNGSTNPGRGLAALDSTTGASMPWAVNSVIRNAGTNAAMYSLYSDGQYVYGTGYDAGGSTPEDGFEGTFKASWTDGTTAWIEDCHGDSYSVATLDDVVYVSGHMHYCGNIGGFPQPAVWVFHHSLAFTPQATGTITADPYGYRSFTGNPSPSLEHWFPTWTAGTYTGLQQATWSVTSSGDYLLFGGEFRAVDGAQQQGLVRFAKRDIAPNKQGPQVQGAAWALNATSYVPNQARLSWNANYDRDDTTLSYSVLRQDLGSTPIYTTTQDSDFWTTPLMSYVDKTVVTGQTYRYRIVVTDPSGNSTNTGDWIPVTISANPNYSAYNASVMNDSPLHYWPLGETSGSAGADWASGSNLTLHSPSAQGVTGPNLAQSSTATTFSGQSSSYASSTNLEDGLQTFTLGAWFKTTSTSGGKIVGFGNSATGTSSSYDRQIYLDASGHVIFGVYNGATNTVSSSQTYRDGTWHYVVATLGPDGETLYVDGKRATSRSDATQAQDYSGYWRVGGDSLGSWPGASSSFLKGSISDVAVYTTELTRDQVDAQWVASGRSSAITAAPSDAYGKAVYSLDPTLFWRLDETSGTVASDAGPDGVTGTYWGRVTKGSAGALTGVAQDKAAAFNPTSTQGGGVGSTVSFTNPTTYATEAWFKTTSTTGGKLMGFGDQSTSLSGNYDRHVFMTSDGKLNFGVYTGTTSVVTSPLSYNDGQWHSVVAQQSATGMQLYVDGTLVGSGTQTAAQSYTGYWRIGGDSTWGGDTYFKGSIDEFAVYPAALTAEEVSDHYQLGAIGSINQPPVSSFSAIATGLTVAFDGSASSDPDGTVAAYAWSFGDGDTAAGSTASHDYAVPGTYPVTLSLTDDRGATSTSTQQVTVQAPNVPPVASFAAQLQNLAVSVDASASNDPDGSIATYSWNFGDGGSATGVTATHNYATAGHFTIALTVTDDRGGSSSISKQVTTVLPPNVLPTAGFTATSDNLGISLNASASDDPDGTIASYAWAFGDDTTGTGVTTSHTYTAAGDYTVTLTVTDDRGGTATAQKSVTVTAAPVGTVLADDDFNRTVVSGWGTATKGGAWSSQGAASSYAVNSGTGTVTLVPSDTRAATLSSVSATDVVTSTTFSVDRTGTGYYVSLVGRKVGSSLYQARLTWEANGATRLYLLHDETQVVTSTLLSNLVYAAGDQLTLKLQVTGTSPTTLSAKVWRAGDAEPTAWQVTGTDTSSAMQTAGSVGVVTHLGGSVPDSSVHLSVARFTATAPVANVAPVAAFTSSVASLTVTFDGADSSDSDGTLASYAWNFGDGTSGTGVAPTHSYGASGSYPVTLTVTDNDGGTGTVQHSVTATASATNAPPVAAFTSSVFDVAATFDGSGSKDTDGSIQSYSWNFGDGASGTGATATHVYAASGNYPVALTVKDNDGASTTIEHDVAVTKAAGEAALDVFQRTASNGWGTATIGGAWTTSGGAAAFTVAGGQGRIATDPGQTRTAVLPGVSATSTTVSLDIVVDKAPIGGAQNITVGGRQVGGSVYSARLRLDPAGQVRLYVLRGETALGDSYLLPGGAYVAGQVLHLVVSVSGTNPTTVSAKAWRDGAAVPSAWQLSATDTTAAMQAAGSTTIASALSGGSTGGTVTLAIKNYLVTTS